MVASSNPTEAAKPGTPPPTEPAPPSEQEAPPVTTEASQPTAAATETAPAQNSSESQTTKAPESAPDASYAACDLPETKEQKDFSGEVETNNDLPSVETQRKIENYVVLDRHGKTHTFKSLYSGRSVARRVLVIFIRHFFCGNCQEYLRTLTASITPDALLGLPVSTFIAVVGCGDPGLIDSYTAATGCPFPIYADPTAKLYSELGMVKTLALGSRPAYMKKSLLKGSIESIIQGLKHIPTGLAFKAGDQRQIGGEFLFEPLNILSPYPITPAREHDKQLGNGSANGAASDDSAATTHDKPTSLHEDEEEGQVEEKRITWCHRMKSTRDHAEVPELMEVLGLDGQGEPIKDQKRWSKALRERKGTGLSMASQMSQISQMRASTAPSSE